VHGHCNGNDSDDNIDVINQAVLIIVQSKCQIDRMACWKKPWSNIHKVRTLGNRHGASEFDPVTGHIHYCRKLFPEFKFLAFKWIRIDWVVQKMNTNLKLSVTVAAKLLLVHVVMSVSTPYKDFIKARKLITRIASFIIEPS